MKKQEIVLIVAILIAVFLLVWIRNFSFGDIGVVNDNKRNYVSRDLDECTRVQILCVSGLERFDDSTGCGCKPISDVDFEQHFCEPESRNVDACIEIYQPVCGWSDPEKIVCVTFPCASTFSNSCFACQDENVLYWTEGECPS